jgi:hypothetical protein
MENQKPECGSTIHTGSANSPKAAICHKEVDRPGGSHPDLHKYETVPACQECGRAMDREGRGWWVGFRVEDGTGALIGVMTVPMGTKSVTHPFIRHELPAPDVHLCGLSHAKAWQSDQLTDIRLPQAA